MDEASAHGWLYASGAALPGCPAICVAEGSFELPTVATVCGEKSRPGYNSLDASEFLDDPVTLELKVRVLAELIRACRARRAVRGGGLVIYSGAGMSTSAGVADYATCTDGIVAAAAPPSRLQGPMMARPTRAHHVIAALLREDGTAAVSEVGAGGACGGPAQPPPTPLLRAWIQQNHDGLPQKAGVPQAVMNEIHGSWFDPANPVVKMSGTLRADLFEALLAAERDADLVLALGTSLCGMNADRVVSSCAARAQQAQPVQQTQQSSADMELTTAGGGGDAVPAPSLGAVVIGLQRTVHDSTATLRIFATLDDVFQLLAKEMDLNVEGDGAAVACSPPVVAAVCPGSGGEETMNAQEEVEGRQDRFDVPYDAEGHLVQGTGGRPPATTVLDLSEGAALTITAGPSVGCPAVVTGRNVEGHWRVQLQHHNHHHNQHGGKKIPAVMRLFAETRLLGTWWIEGALRGELDQLPVVNATASKPQQHVE